MFVDLGVLVESRSDLLRFQLLISFLLISVEVVDSLSLVIVEAKAPILRKVLLWALNVS